MAEPILLFDKARAKYHPDLADLSDAILDALIAATTAHVEHFIARAVTADESADIVEAGVQLAAWLRGQATRDADLASKSLGDWSASWARSGPSLWPLGPIALLLPYVVRAAPIVGTGDD